MNRTGWMAAGALGLLGIGAAVGLYRPAPTQLDCPEGAIRFVDAGAGPPVATCDPAGSRGPAGAVLAVGGKLDLNCATEPELALIPGVGPSLAHAIVEARTHKRFAGWEDVDAVPGVGAGKMEILQSYAEVRP